MNINRDLLIKICILLSIIIIFRFLYIRLTDNSKDSSHKNSHNNTHKNSSKQNKNTKPTIENFEINTGDAIDLLSKLKHNAIIVHKDNNLNNKFIKPWTTKIYNMQSGNQSIKPVALYQPELTFKNQQYCKLGDMLSQNSDYSPPSSTHFTLLIKKEGSDIKPPINYDLIVNFGSENINTNYYDYESYLTTASSQAEIYAILPNIMNCSKIFTNINSLIQNNKTILQTNLSKVITNEIMISANNMLYSITSLVNTGNLIDINITESSFKLPAGMRGTFISNQYVWGKGFNITSPISIPFNIPSTLDSLQTNNKNQIASYVPLPFKHITANNIDIVPYNNNLIIKLLPITSIINLIKSLCNDLNTIYSKHISNTNFLRYLNLINDAQTITTILNHIDSLNTFLAQYANINTITISSNPEIQAYVDPIFQVNCGNTVTGKALDLLKNFAFNYNLTYITFTEDNIKYPLIPLPPKQGFEDIPKSKTSSKSTDVIEPFDDFDTFFEETVPGGFNDGFNKGLYEQGLKPFAYGTRDVGVLLGDGFVTMGNGIAYGGNTVGCYLSGGAARDACKDGAQGAGGDGKNTAGGANGSGLDKNGNPIKLQFINQLQMTSFANNFVLNLPESILNINLNPAYSSMIKDQMKNLTDFTLFLNDLKNNTVKNLPLKIYKPIAPKGYVSLGHVFCNIQAQLVEPLTGIKANDEAGNGVCCVPENCVKEMREWNISDKMFEYNNNGIYWALYYNPYTGTFISTNRNNFPDGRVCKVVACVKKCTAVEDLSKADDCIRNYYNMNKKNSAKLAPDLVSDTEEEYYLGKVKAQSDTITKLYKKANSMQLDMDKATIVNAEMNKNKLQTYVDTQKRNIDIVTQRLEEDSDKIQTNINIPLDVLNALLKMIKNSKKLSKKQKTDLTDQLLDNKKMADANLITNSDYDKNLNKIMSNCPDYDLSGLVKKDVVSSVCYGCPS